ncbi:tetratricopeptide repeat protein [Chryseobacterium shigense]|uniref:Tetratricopeptide (TPR) repeat protein n=1 Tax=Chryseobacterium shigense TaxID=297244 RepID=A0A841NK30_9FLAO|nr:tetratricopeptide repeat protein [Chryseobacterium shigense]MBB6371145.1 tetratricopeptide (TPR) repeat protein [Chryseobacterium shigense]
MMKIIFFILPILLTGQQKITPQHIDAEYSKLEILYAEAKTDQTFKKNIFLLNESKKINYSRGIAMGYLWLSFYYSNLRNYKKGLDYLKLAEEEAKHSKDDIKLQSEITKQLGGNYYNVGLYQEAINEYKENIKLADDTDDHNAKIYIKSLALFKIGVSFKKRKQPDSCKWYLKKGISLLQKEKKLPHILEMNKIYYSLMLTEYDVAENKIDLAERNVKAVEARAKKILANNNYQLYKVKAMIYAAKKEYDSAISNYQKAIILAKNSGNKERLKVLYGDISKTYEEAGDKEFSKQYLEKSNHLKDSLDNAKQPAIENAVKELIGRKETNVKTKTRFLVYIIWAGILSAIISAFLIIKRIRRKNKILNAKEQETQLLNQQLNLAFEEVIQLAKSNSPEFITRFQEVYPNFFKNLLKVEPQLVNTELKFCALLFLHFSTKDIAAYTFVQPQAIQIRKNRLRKKLSIPSNEDIYTWMQNINQA